MSDYRIGRYRGKFCVVWYDDAGQRHRHTLGTTDPSEADRLARRLMQVRPDAPTVGWLWDAYCDENRAKAVIATMTHTAKALRPAFFHLEPDLIDIRLCRQHAEARQARGIRPGTIHTELGHLRTVLSWAVKRGHIHRAPHIERPAKPAPRDRYLTREEAVRLMDGAAAFHVRLAIILMLSTAARSGAILGLTWDRVDFQRGLIALTDPDDDTRRKGRATVPMNRMARAALTQAREAALTGHVIEWAGKPVRSLKKGLATAAGKAGLSGVTPHVLRHTAAVWLAEAGTPMSEIAQYLGHSDSRITERVYARFSPEYLRSSAEVLELSPDLLNAAPQRPSRAGR